MKRSAIGLHLDVYHFWGYRIGIRSNSDEILSHFRSVYGRFYNGEELSTPKANGQAESTQACIIEAVDNIASRQELLLNDGKEFYELRCKNLYEFDPAYYGKGSVPDPIAFITYLFLKNKYRIIQRYLLFHAAAISHNGQAIVLPAPERMGKTTLSVQLVKSGFKFLSDEVACIDPKRKILKPYPRKLNLNAESCDMLNLPEWPEESLRRSGADGTEWSVDIEQIVPGSLSPECFLSHIIFLRGFGETPRLEPVSSSNALFKLFKFSFTQASRPASQLYKFASIMDGVDCYNLVCAEPERTADLIMRTMDNRETI